MTLISLKEIIDDVLLLVRNNNISESEDLSRAQVAVWVRAYKSRLHLERLDYIKQQAKQNGVDWLDLIDDELLKIKEILMELEPYENTEDVRDKRPIFTKVTTDTLDNVFNNSENSILAVHDREGENIQYVNHIRRHYQYYRKYTYGEMTAYYKDDGHIYILGLSDMGMLKYVYVKYLYEEPDNISDGTGEDDSDEGDIMIPGWMVPQIKELIIKNELSFMLNRPSDDSNNATLASVKPHGPQDDEE